jgi:hypothetical protein
VNFGPDPTTNIWNLFLRAQNLAKIEAVTSYEVNIRSATSTSTYGTGAIVNVAKLVPGLGRRAVGGTFTKSPPGNAAHRGAERADRRRGQQKFAQGRSRW